MGYIIYEFMRMIAEMKREFQLQMLAMQNLITNQQEQTKASVAALQKELQDVTKKLPAISAGTRDATPKSTAGKTIPPGIVNSYPVNPPLSTANTTTGVSANLRVAVTTPNSAAVSNAQASIASDTGVNNCTGGIGVPSQRETADPCLGDVFSSTSCAASMTTTTNTTRFHPATIARTTPAAGAPTNGMSTARSTNVNAFPSFPAAVAQITNASGSHSQAGISSDEYFANFNSLGYAPARAHKIYPLPKFGGQPEEWQAFIEDFQTTTIEFQYNELHSIMRIREALYGPAREMVESLLSSAKNINAILTTLAETYGRPEQLIKSQLEKVQSLQPVPERKLDRLIAFANKVNNMLLFLQSVGAQHHLVNPFLVSELVSKLPMTHRMQWAEKCMELGRAPNIVDFGQWLTCLRRFANMVTDSLLPSQISINSRAHGNVPGVNKGKYSMFSLARRKCIICEGDCQSLASCEKFTKLPVERKWEHVKEMKVCFACLKSNHTVNKCFSKKCCGINNCQKYHNRLLHSIHTDSSESSTSDRVRGEVPHEKVSCHVGRNANEVLFQIMPVKLMNREKEVVVYAFIDDGADVFMLDWSIANDLGLSGTKEHLEISWLNGHSEKEPTEVVELGISGTASHAKQFKISKVYLNKNLILPKQSFNKNEVLGFNPSFDDVPLDSYSDVQPKMIIILTHAFLTVPIEGPRLSAINMPAICKSRLGWVIFGPTGERSTTKRSVLHAHRIKHNDDSEMDEIMRQYFEIETCGVKTNARPLTSKADDRALKILNDTIKLKRWSL
ncbi:uncharacterized protein LOC118756234 [Rhagoletis pomonella]|uniref:uncharacterized protein LOC118756234 n=1 Tax=Rhagoletis pomonella TaxID=28610 RepID=UPI00177C4FD5|nr:uncharacterized protein LOC118756234 [Rhagoletis pomonella]